MDEDNLPQPQAQNPEPASEPTPPVSTEQQEPVQPEPEAAPPQPEPEPVIDEKPKPSRAERRIHQLNEKIRQQAQQNQFGPQQQSPQFPRYEDGQQVSPEQLERDVVQTADAIATARVAQQLAQRDAVNYFERDSERLPTMFEELNPANTDTYTPELDEAIAQDYQERAFKVIGYNQATGEPITQLDPSVRLADIAERHVKAARAYAARTSATMRNAVAQTADEAAPRPNADVPDERKFEDLSIDEMEKRLGFGPQR